MGYRYFMLFSGTKAIPIEVLRTSDGVEELFVPDLGWQSSRPSERAHYECGEIDENYVRQLLDSDERNRFMSVDRQYSFFALTDGTSPQAVLRRWTDEHGEHEDVLVTLHSWVPSTPARYQGLTAVPIDVDTVDRFAAAREERSKGRRFHRYFVVVNQRGAPVAVVRERPVTGEVETCLAYQEWERGTVPGRRVPICLLEVRDYLARLTDPVPRALVPQHKRPPAAP